MTSVYRNILVPTDGSAPSARAARAAVRLAGPGGRITALHVIPAFRSPTYIDAIAPVPELYSVADYKRSTQAYAARLLARVERRARAAKVRCNKVTVFDNRPWKAILRTARASGCGLIVMGSHGRRGVDRLLLGSETNKVLAHSKKPVLVCR